jgi:hypothetical protein
MENVMPATKCLSLTNTCGLKLAASVMMLMLFLLAHAASAESSLAPTTSPRPMARPVSSLAPTVSLRPKPRPTFVCITLERQMQIIEALVE